jgi:hypothetical protein
VVFWIFHVLISFSSSFSSSFFSFIPPPLLLPLFFGLSLTHLLFHSLISSKTHFLLSLSLTFSQGGVLHVLHFLILIFSSFRFLLSIYLFSSLSSTTVTLFSLTFSQGGLLDIPHLSFTISSFFFLLLQPSHCFSFSPFFHAPSISSTPSFSLTSSFSSYLTSTLILTFPPPSFFSSFHFRSFFFSRILITFLSYFLFHSLAPHSPF